jgi:hypothetical protein
MYPYPILWCKHFIPNFTLISKLKNNGSSWLHKSYLQIYSLFISTVNLSLLLFSIDIDECKSTPCDKNAACANTDGSFICTCKTGYSGDGFNCEGKHNFLCCLIMCLYVLNSVLWCPLGFPHENDGSVRLYLQLFVRGLTFSLRFLCLFTHSSSVLHI